MWICPAFGFLLLTPRAGHRRPKCFPHRCNAKRLSGCARDSSFGSGEPGWSDPQVSILLR